MHNFFFFFDEYGFRFKWLRMYISVYKHFKLIIKKITSAYLLKGNTTVHITVHGLI